MRIPFNKMVIGLDRIMFGTDSIHYNSSKEHSEAIKAYLESNGWSWDSIIDHMANEETISIPTSTDN